MKILVVEDSKLQATLLRRLLEEAGYQVCVAHHGLQALEEVARDCPDLIVSDIDMPEMNGYELCRAIKSETSRPPIPVILLTSLSDPRNVIQGLQAGADNYVTKPYDGPRLLSRVDSLLRSPTLFLENSPEEPLQVSLGGETFRVDANRGQILNLLLSTFESAVWQNEKLRQSNEQLQQIHKELEEKNRQLEAAMETQNRFIGMAAHDMRNPLSVMLGYGRLLLDGVVGPLQGQQPRFVGSIVKATESLLHLVNELLEISEIESGNLRLELQPTDLEALVQQTSEMNGFLAKEKNIQVITVTEPIPILELDPGKIEQVLNNLLSNAVKFSHPNTQIRVELKCQGGDEVRLSVSDQGQGIPESEQASLFQPFQRTSVRSTAGEKSTGLGLAIVKRIVEGLGARLELESRPGVGSTFSVLFPVDL